MRFRSHLVGAVVIVDAVAVIVFMTNSAMPSFFFAPGHRQFIWIAGTTHPTHKFQPHTQKKRKENKTPRLTLFFFFLPDTSLSLSPTKCPT